MQKQNVATIRQQYLGVKLVIIVFVVAQFLEIDVGTIFGVSVSLQKLLAIIIYPIAIIFMRKLVIKPILVIFTLFLWASFVFALFINKDIESVISASIVVLVGFFGAVVLYTAFSINFRASIRYLGLVWIQFSIFSSIVAVLQSLGLFPLLTVPESLQNLRDVSSGYVRGVGFKFDPNFLALMLALAIPFILIYVERWYLKYFYFFIVFAGILATFSRMGIILTGSVFLLLFFLNQKKKNFLNIILAIIFIVATIGLLFFGPRTIRLFVIDRFYNIYDFFYVLSTGVTPIGWISSTIARAIVLRIAFQTALQHWIIGIGAFQVIQYIGSESITNYVTHNTFIEIFLIGGLTGIITLSAYLFVVLSTSIKLLFSRRGDVPVIILLNWVMLISCIFLSLTYNSIFWFPLVISLAAKNTRKVKS